LTTQISYKSMQISTVYHIKIDARRISQLLSVVDKSMQSSSSSRLGLLSNSFIKQDDVICVSNKMLYWFSASAKGTRIVRSGGGLLAGMWEIENKNRVLSLKRVSEQNKVQNLLYPGNGKGFFGADAYGGYQNINDDIVVWGLEHSINTKKSDKFGKDIIKLERGAFASDEGVFIEFQGILGNSKTLQGIESLTDTDPRPGVIGQTMYTLTYRIPANKAEFIQEVTFKALSNNFGPIQTAKLALYFPGYGSGNTVYAANTELMKRKAKLVDVAVNSYFKNSCEKKVYFYKVPFVNKAKKMKTITSSGRGTIGCIGSPDNRIPFICAYPNNEFIPKIAYEDYSMEIYDNQSIPQYGRFHGITYKLLKSPKKSYTVKAGKSLILIMRYKVIPAFIKLNSKKKSSV